VTDQPPEDTPPTRKERITALADKLCRSYTYGVGLDETAADDPEEARAHRRAARRLLKWVEEAPDEEISDAFRRGFDRGRERQKKRTEQDMARLEAEVAELRQDRDPDGLRARIRSLEYALHGWDTLMMGRDRKAFGMTPDWKQTAADYLAQLVEAQRELAELKGHQPSNATRREQM
jgi:hypothetical protein